MMTTNSSLVVCDTSVVSIIHRQDPRASFYENYLDGKRAVVSFQALEEICFLPLKNNWNERRRNELMLHLDQYDIVWPNQDLVHISAQLRTDRERAGRRLNTADAWIAATAIMLRCPLASHDRDFSSIPNLHLIQAPRP